MAEDCCWLFLANALGMGHVLLSMLWIKRKDMLWERDLSRKLSGRHNNTHSVGIVWGSSKAILPPPRPTSLFSPTATIVVRLYQGYQGAGGKGHSNRSSLNAMDLTVFTRIHLLFLNKHFMDYCRLVKFQNSENNNFEKFLQCSHCFYRG